MKRTTEELPPQGDHFEICFYVYPTCQCLTCKRDFQGEGTACCIKHKGEGCCPISKCPDYVKDEPKKKGREEDGKKDDDRGTGATAESVR